MNIIDKFQETTNRYKITFTGIYNKLVREEAKTFIAKEFKLDIKGISFHSYSYDYSKVKTLVFTYEKPKQIVERKVNIINVDKVWIRDNLYIKYFKVESIKENYTYTVEDILKELNRLYGRVFAYDQQSLCNIDEFNKNLYRISSICLCQGGYSSGRVRKYY